MTSWYQVVHLILPIVGFWIAITLVASVFFKRSQRRWPLSMITAGVLVAAIVGGEVGAFGLHNMP